MTGKIGIIGAGGQADETVSYFGDAELAFYALSESYVDPNNELQINIATPTEEQRLTPVVAGIGAAAIRRQMIEMWPGENFATIVSSAAYVDPSAKLSAGVTIAPNVVITTNVEIGAHTIINVGATVSHNSKLGEFVTVSPGANLAGHVELGDGVFVGIGATISNGITIAAGSVIGAGAVVMSDVLEENSVLVGVPARVIKRNEGWIREI